MEQDNSSPKSGNIRIEVPAGTITTATYPPTVWQTYRYAPEWFGDAVRESGRGGHHARRREILFAVCAAESYIFEWVRDIVLKHDFQRLSAYFPSDAKRGVTAKFKEVPRALQGDGLVQAILDCGGSEFADFRRLVELRDGLVHARASRPSTGGLPEESRPVPSKNELDILPAGWATEVVRRLLGKLHQDTQTPRPDWL
jgi:hypothetical protein